MLQLRITHLPLPITSPILLLILFVQIATNVAHCSNIDSSVQAQKLCSTPPDWRFYDIVNHLAAIEVTPDVAPNVTTYTDSTNSSIVTTVTVTDATVANQQNVTVAAPIQFRYNQNGSTLEDVTVLNPIHEFFREPFGNIRNNVTMIVLTNLQEHRLRNEQQIYNLEQIYRSLIGVHLKNIRFILINSRESFNPRWVWETRKRVSFEVYQEVPTSPIIGSLLKGGNGDIFIYDRCALLTYYIPFPLSFIHTQQPILQAAILATYFDSPCKARCDNNPTTIATNSSQSNDTSNVATEVITSTLATNLLEPPTDAATTIATILTTLPTTNVDENATIVAIPEQTDTSNVTDASTPIATVTNQTVTSTTTAEPGLNEMGQILMKFFGQILPQSTSPVQSVVTNATIPDSVQNETKIELNSEVQQNIVAVNQTTEVKIETNVEVSNGTVTVETKQNATIVTATRPGSSTSSTLLNRLRYSHKVEESTCNTQVCNEWSTERLLKARLCCLNFQSVEDNDPDTPATLPPQNVANLDGSNLDSHFEPNETVQDGSFGCHVYARWRCNRIMPVIKCCLRKVLNKYFDFTIKLREQQQKAQMMNGHQSSSSPLMPQPMAGSGGHYSLKTHLLNEGPNVSIEYPGDYVLQHHHSGSSQSQFQQDYFKQQHRKRMLQQRSNARA